jgi:hypothetical protein
MVAAAGMKCPRFMGINSIRRNFAVIRRARRGVALIGAR